MSFKESLYITISFIFIYILIPILNIILFDLNNRILDILALLVGIYISIIEVLRLYSKQTYITNINHIVEALFAHFPTWMLVANSFESFGSTIKGWIIVFIFGVLLQMQVTRIRARSRQK